MDPKLSLQPKISAKKLGTNLFHKKKKTKGILTQQRLGNSKAFFNKDYKSHPKILY